MPGDLPELRASHQDRDRVVDTLRTAGGDGRLTAGKMDAGRTVDGAGPHRGANEAVPGHVRLYRCGDHVGTVRIDTNMQHGKLVIVGAS
jgi:hypothetical protein